MVKQTGEIDIPKQVRGNARLEYLETTRELLKELTVLRLFEDGKVSAGYAANLLDLDQHAFDQLLAKNRISRFNYTPEELDEEFKVVAELAKKLSFRVKHKKAK